ncbi:MAG TPA: hypothetical protein VKA46_30765 [Gemmataceae bacterium]|nr:hypothetical protein [Gemmataceae bacterium]
MTTTELLAELACQGFSLTPDGDGIRVTPASRLTAELREAIKTHKAELLALLEGREEPDTALAWDQAEAERLLAELRDRLARLERTWPGGKFPPVKANVLQIGVEVCEAYVRDHDLEASRGWDALALLRAAVPGFLRLARPQHLQHRAGDAGDLPSRNGTRTTAPCGQATLSARIDAVAN